MLKSPTRNKKPSSSFDDLLTAIGGNETETVRTLVEQRYGLGKYELTYAASHCNHD
jgi:hypothetical protein